ncbi:MAG: hypothetical protein AAGB12_12850 [Pseudomonadota bacterium]
MHNVEISTKNQTLFDQQLQDFAKDISIVCALEAGGKFEASDAFEQIKQKWKLLKKKKKQLIDGTKELVNEDNSESVL